MSMFACSITVNTNSCFVAFVIEAAFDKQKPMRKFGEEIAPERLNNRVSSFKPALDLTQK